MFAGKVPLKTLMESREKIKPNNSFLRKTEQNTEYNLRRKEERLRNA